ncbi:hypothetical protein EIP91_002841 [Steccherinum ochraceum]|uniref:Uncharacterized protein n=1 Tax=Steccherinum ochraceum TaxID=92696 RepID=A0A4R0RJU4_9APHY|nr:hypothetical protein EIP91_002841 [Steccherinum ochraceum]
MPAYTASKFAVRGLTQAFAIEMAPHNITVNAYCPGFTLTDMLAHESDALYGDGSPGSYIQHAAGMSKMPKAEPHVIASFISYLCKPEAYFITGQSNSICGGLTMS